MTKESYNFGVDTEAKQLYTETSGMTVKRFTIDKDINLDSKVETYELNCIRDNENQTFYFIADSLENVQLFVKRLNELHEENIELHIQNDFLKDENQHMRDLVNENEQLKQELNAFKPVVFQDMRKGTVILYRKGDVE